jgi:hypothetical protein
MRSLAPLLSLTLAAVVLGACGSGSQRASGGASPAARTTTADAGSYMNDGDKDLVGDADGDEGYKVPDVDKDHRLDEVPRDYQIHENTRYHDADDHGALVRGYPAGAAQQRAVIAAVERYNTAVDSGDGARACSQLTAGLARAVPVDYGQHGPAYVHSAKTCAAVLSLLFEHEHQRLAVPVAVTSVRMLAPSEAHALVGSPGFPASYTILRDERGAWKMAQILASDNGLS